MRLVYLLLGISVLICSPGYASAAPAAGDRSSAALALSGGISLGSYEAGLNWAIVKHFRDRSRQQPGPYKPLLGTFTGASAGNINALLSSISMCVAPGKESEFPFSSENNLFRDTWLDIGFEDLLPDGPDAYEKDDALMSRKAFESVIGKIDASLKQKIYIPGCSVSFAVTVTREKAADIHPAGTTLSVKNSRFVIPMQLVVGSDGYAEIHSLPVKEDHEYLGNVIYLAGPEPVVSDAYRLVFHNDQPYSVASAILASSAFPGAFGKKELTYCLHDADRSRKDDGCPAGYRKESAYFVDGGVFDNVPLGALRALTMQDKSGRQPDHYLYLDPDIRRGYATGEASEVCENVNGEEPTLSEMFTQFDFFPDAIETARQYELYGLVRHKEPWLKRIRTPNRYFELTASFMGNFGAFWDRGFRQFDYAAGVYDAAYYLAEISAGHRPQAEDLLHVFEELEINPDSDVAEVFELLLNDEFGTDIRIASASSDHREMKILFAALKSIAGKKDAAGVRCFEQFVGKLFRDETKAYKPEMGSYLNHIAHPRNRGRSIEAWMYPLTYRLSERAIALNKTDGDTSEELATKFTALGINSVYRDETRLLTASSAPTDAYWFRLLPYEIAVDSANGGIFAAYEWQLFPLTNELSLRLKVSPFIWYRRAGVINRSSQIDVMGRYQFNSGLNIGAGPTFNYSWTKPGTAIPVNTGVAGYIGYVDKFRVTSGVRSVHADFGGYNFYVMIGVTDVPGITYWLTR